MGLPKGSCGMAPQTRLNLQSCCLAILVITVTKEKLWNPWNHGFGRLSEMPVEHWFSSLRRQSPKLAPQAAVAQRIARLETQVSSLQEELLEAECSIYDIYGGNTFRETSATYSFKSTKNQTYVEESAALSDSQLLLYTSSISLVGYRMPT